MRLPRIAAPTRATQATSMAIMIPVIAPASSSLPPEECKKKIRGMKKKSSMLIVFSRKL